MDVQNISLETETTDNFCYIPFSERIRQIRKAAGETQEVFAARLGISKQILSLYEQGRRSPKVDQIERYAKIMDLSPDYLLGSSAEEMAAELILSDMDGVKPFYELFSEITGRMDLTLPAICHMTGLSARQVQTISSHRMKYAPLSIALRLSETLNVPLCVWTGEEEYSPVELSPQAYEVVRAYETAGPKEQYLVRYALDLEPMETEGADT